MAVRRKFIGGNWKCAASRAEAAQIVEFLNAGGSFDGVDVAVFPSAIHAESARAGLRKDVYVGAQDVFTAKGYGAFTGEHTAEVLLDAGLSSVIVGHSERRHIIGESNALSGEKARVALAAGLTVVFCVGETLAERESDSTLPVLVSQLEGFTSGGSGVPPSAWPALVIAYEPVWAIGTGKVATPAQAQEAHASIRAWLSRVVSPEVARSVRIIYGGSVKGSNCAELAALPDVDGFLVGGASLKPEFVDIVRSCLPTP